MVLPTGSTRDSDAEMKWIQRDARFKYVRMFRNKIGKRTAPVFYRPFWHTFEIFRVSSSVGPGLYLS